MLTIEPLSNKSNKKTATSTALPVSKTTVNNPERKANKPLESIKPNQKHQQSTGWWFDFYTMAGRKSENQDSLLITTCLLSYLEQIKQDNKAHSPKIKLDQSSCRYLLFWQMGSVLVSFPNRRVNWRLRL